LVATLAPAAWLAVRALQGGLGANPIEAATRFTGAWALRLLLATLALTPLRRWLGWHGAVAYRRTLGLAAFAYAVAHLGIWIVLDHGLDGAAIIEDVLERPFVTAGMAAFALLLPLALTSTRGWMRRLGRRWAQLHRLVYLAAGLAVLHFLWLVKADLRPPLVHASILALLLAARLRFGRRRRRREDVRTVRQRGDRRGDAVPAAEPRGTLRASRAGGGVAIVCGTDFSAGAAHALRVAAVFARALGERLVLVHVVDLGALAWAAGRLPAEIAQAAEARLAELAAPLVEQGLAVETRTLVGTPDEQIAEVARESGARLAVIGVLGNRPATRWRIGSLAARLARAAPVPVLLVADATPFEQCAAGARPLRVLAAAAPSPSGDVAAGWLATLRRLGACDALLLHVYDPGSEQQRLGLPVRADDGDPAVEAVLRRDLEQRLGALGGPGATEIRATPRLGWVAETLALVAEREHFDLLLVGGRPRGGLSRIRQDSVSEGLLRLAPTSVLRVPLAAGAEEHAPPPPRLATLLAPSDLSPLSNEGVRYAYALAPDGGTVVLLHVIEVPPLPSPLYAHYGRRLPPEARAERARAAEAALRALVPADAEARGIETRVEIVEGEPGEAIRAAAERWGADAVCLASHGRSGLSRLLGGSVAQALAETCPRPLLLVRPAQD
jgi:sulfoxide reductase heme-binding subunit YedZ